MQSSLRVGIVVAIVATLAAWVSFENFRASSQLAKPAPADTVPSPSTKTAPEGRWVMINVVIGSDCVASFMRDGDTLPPGPNFQEEAFLLADVRIYQLFSEYPVCETATAAIVEPGRNLKRKPKVVFLATMRSRLRERSRGWFPMVDVSRDATITCRKCEAPDPSRHTEALENPRAPRSISPRPRGRVGAKRTGP